MHQSWMFCSHWRPAPRHLHAVRPLRHHQPGVAQVLQHRLACYVAVQAAVLLRRVVVQGGGDGQDRQRREAVALAYGKVVEIVSRRDLHAAGSEFGVHERIGDDRDLATGQRQHDLGAHQRPVARIVGMHRHGDVAQHRLGARGGHHHAGARGPVGGRVTDLPQAAVLFLVFDFQVRHRRLQLRIPIHQSLSAVDQALLVQAREGLYHDARKPLVHREVGARPVAGVAQALHLLQDGVARLLLPLPDAVDEILPCHVAPLQALLLELALHHDLGRDAGVVGSGKPQRVEPAHPVVAGQRVHDRVVERMPHVQNAGYVRRGQLDSE
jgi:hypothetical protein